MLLISRTTFRRYNCQLPGGVVGCLLTPTRVKKGCYDLRSPTKTSTAIRIAKIFKSIFSSFSAANINQPITETDRQYDKPSSVLRHESTSIDSISTKTGIQCRKRCQIIIPLTAMVNLIYSYPLSIVDVKENAFISAVQRKKDSQGKVSPSESGVCRQ